MLIESTIELSIAKSEQDLETVRGLMREYLVWHGTRYSDYHELLERYFDYDGYQLEMDCLPVEYDSPKGCLLLARRGDDVDGCVALRDLGAGIAEMKRMFVRSRAQGSGIEERLAKSVIQIASALGYKTMRLDTGPLQTDAVNMYQKLGFKFIEPYYDLPPALGEMLVFIECDLIESKL
jgi:GNAT superfamily N-acetyltransferase